MGIVYLISSIILIVLFMMIKKTEKNLDFLGFLGISIVLFMGYNALICFVCGFINVPVNLITLSVINALFSILMAYLMYKQKEKQKFNFDKVNAFFIAIILAVTLGVSIANFGLPFNIKYETGDPATHYHTSVLFEEQDRVINRHIDEVYEILHGRKFASYVNSGIIMKCLSNVIDKIDYYNVFIAFGIFVLFMTGAIMYNALEKYTKTIGGKIIALIVSLIYVLGYPLNSLLFGFEYMSLGILVVGTIISAIYYFDNEELKYPYILIIFALLNFELFCSYYMFVPFVYSAMWIYFCVHSKNNNGKILSKKNVVLLIVTLLIPFILGYIYHLAPGIYNIFGINLEEAIYINFYSNMLLLLPLAVKYIFRKKEENEFARMDILLLVFNFAFIQLLIVGVLFDKVSTYFVMKNYYILWMMLIYTNFKELMHIYDKNKKIPYILICGYVALIVFNLIFVNEPLENDAFNKYETPLNVVEIFNINKTILTDRDTDISTEELELLKYAKKNIDFETNDVELLADPEEIFWTYSLLRYINHDDFLDGNDNGGQQKMVLKAISANEKIGKVDYMIYFTDNIFYKMAEEKLFKKGKIIYENDAGGIVQFN